MLTDLHDNLNSLLGLSENSLDLSVDQMVIRAAIVYFFTLAIVRFGHKRLLGHFTAFDIVLGIILGSVVSRAVTGSSAFVPTLAAAVALVLIHWLVAATAYRFPWLGGLVKGKAQPLVENGKVNRKNMQSSHISDRDLQQALREHANITDPAQVVSAQLERSGSISVIPRHDSPQIIEIEVEEGVQTVRIKLE